MPPNIEKMKRKRNVRGLIKALNNEDAKIRQAAAEALGQVSDVRAVEPLKAALKDDDEGMRAAAASALGQIEDEQATSKAAASGTMSIYGLEFSLTDDLNTFLVIASARRRGVLRMTIRDYPDLLGKVSDHFLDRFGKQSDYYGATHAAQLVCSQCSIVFPDSFTFGLMMKGMSSGLPMMVGATPGHKEFAEQARCPKCGSDTALYVYDNIAGEDIQAADLDALRAYWRDNALNWWKKQSRQGAICDLCSGRVKKNEGYISRSDLLCEDCCNKHLGTDALENLRGNPYGFGAGELRKARYWMAVKSRTLSESEKNKIAKNSANS